MNNRVKNKNPIYLNELKILFLIILKIIIKIECNVYAGERNQTININIIK
jgi:hypothetical protein